MEKEYILFKEISDYFQKVGVVIYALDAVIDSRVDISPDDLQPDKDSKETFHFSSEIYEDVKELAGVLSDEQVKGVLDKIEELIFIIPNEKAESTLTSLLAVGRLDGRTINTSARYFGKFVAFTDAGVMNFNQHEKLPDGFPIEEKKYLRGVWQAVFKFLKRLTFAVDRMRNADGKTTSYTVSYMFPKPSREKESTQSSLFQRRLAGAEIEPSQLTADQVCYILHVAGGCPNQNLFGMTDLKLATVLTEIRGGGFSTYTKALGKIRKAQSNETPEYEENVKKIRDHFNWKE